MISLGEVCKDRVFLASTVLKIYRHERQETELLRLMNEREVQSHSEGWFSIISQTEFTSAVEFFIQ